MTSKTNKLQTETKPQGRRRGATVAGLFGLALASVLLLCGAGNVPVENFTPQGPMQADLNAGGHSITNAATVSANNVTVSGALTAPGFTLPVTSVSGAGNGVTSALAQPVNGANGVVVADANNRLPYDPHAANLENTTDIFEGDSITYGLGLTSPSTQSFPALFAAMNYANGHSTVYDVGVPSATIPAGSNGGNNISDHYAANVYPHRPWATAASTAGTGTITGDGNVTITGSGTAFTTQLAVGGTIYFNGHLAKIATIPSATQLTIATTAIPNSTVATSLAGINPTGASFTFGGDGGPRANLHLMIGTNDLSGGAYTAAQIVANLTSYTTQALNDRFTVILSTILPAARNGTPESVLNKIYLTVNQAIRNGTIPSSLVADSAIILNNPSDFTYFQSDQLHPTAAGDVLLAAYYNAGMTAGTFGARPAEGQFESPLFANFFGPLYGTVNPAVNGSGLVAQPVYYTYYAPGYPSQGFGIDSNLALESFGVVGAKWSWDTGGYQSTGGTANEVMYLDYNGNLRINGNFKSLATQVGGAGAALAVNSRTCFYSALNETLTLPATCAVGDTVTVVGSGTLSGLFTITKASGQSIYMGSGTAYSSITEQAPGDAVVLTCTLANTSWTASSLVGSFTETP